MANIVLVDDDPGMREIVSSYLEMAGHRVVVYDSPVAALEAILKEPPDLVVTDNDMPRMTGEEMLSRLPGVKAVMMTGNTDLVAEHSGLLFGVHPMVAKPFMREKLMEVVERRLGCSAA